MQPASPSGNRALLFAGRYELSALLGTGGMGDVWRGRDVALERPVAIKRLRVVDEEASARLLGEARALATLRDPSIVQVFDYGFDESGLPFVVMELLEGPTLAAHLLARGSLGAIGAVQLLLPVVSALTRVHAAGIVHRDLKPENLILEAGLVPKLIDFGIARKRDPLATRVTRVGTFVGTPDYMAPEQVVGEEGDARTDVWGVATVIYEAMAGSAPHRRATLSGTFRAIAYDPPPFPAQVRDLNGRLWAILVRALNKQPGERHRSCADLEADLRAWLTHPQVTSQRPLGAVPMSGPPPIRDNSRVPDESAAITIKSVETPLDALVRSRAAKY